MHTIKWTDRRFHFGYEPGYVPLFIERLRGTAPRLKELVADIPDEQLSFQKEGQWSIKQHIGHLIDLESLHDRRLDDFLNGADVLSPADMTNRKTYEADHNARSVEELITGFERVRTQFIDRVLRFTPGQLSAPSLHPRLREEVTVVDILFFLAEHDNAHLTLISALRESPV